MNKAELISSIAAESGLTNAESRRALEAFVTTVTQALKRGEKVSLVGFGTLTVHERAARVGVNPSTGEKIEIAAKKAVKFKPGTNLILD